MDDLEKHALRPGAGHRLRTLRERFRSASRDWRYDSWHAPWRRWRRYFGEQALTGLLVGAVLCALVWGFLELAQKFGSPELAVRHLAAAPNCDAARAAGVAPARLGEAGYWPSHDRDGDGVACEPYPRR